MAEVPRAGSREWTALGALALPVILISVDMTVLNFAIPWLAESLRPDSTELLWIVDVYGFFLAGLLVLMGNLGDRIGRRKLLLAGGAAFGVASALAAFAPSAGALIAARAVMGLGGATLMPSTLSMIRSIFPHPTDRRTAIGIWSGAFAAGAGMGPIIGGFLMEHFWWGSVFLINVPVMMILLVAAPFVLPESRDPAPGRFDLLSALLWLGAILPVVYGLKELATQGFGVGTALWLVGGIVAGVLFVVRQFVLDDPLIDLTLFRSREFSVAVLVNMLGIFALVGMLFYVPQYLQIVRDLDPMSSGWWIMPAVGGSILGAVAATLAARRYPLPRIIAVGLVLSAAGFWVGSAMGVHTTLVLVAVAGVLIGFGSDLAGTLTNDVIMSGTPADKAGRASAVSETSYELGGALGTAVLGSIGNAVYVAEIAKRLPHGLPEGVTIAAEQTLGNAEVAAAQLPGELRHLVEEAAELAFTQAMSTSLLVAGVFVAAGALLSLLVDRSSGQDVSGRETGPRERPEDGEIPRLEEGVVGEGVPGDRGPEQIAQAEPVAAHQPGVEPRDLREGAEDL
ncbi:MAG: transporter, family, multidrug resistance protein [Actinomycetota bacterium]|nr:transporter, family, multidrug resistance protein [Actinomycetota bacterium]